MTDRHEPLSDDELDLLHRVASDAIAPAGGLDRDDQERLGALALHAWTRLQHARLIERLAWIAHWAADAIWSTVPDPAVLPDGLDPLWAYMHAILDHGEEPDQARIDELEQVVFDTYELQRPPREPRLVDVADVTQADPRHHRIGKPPPAREPTDPPSAIPAPMLTLTAELLDELRLRDPTLADVYTTPVSAALAELVDLRAAVAHVVLEADPAGPTATYFAGRGWDRPWAWRLLGGLPAPGEVTAALREAGLSRHARQVWLTTPSGWLDGTVPAALLRRGDVATVLDAIDRWRRAGP